VTTIQGAAFDELDARTLHDLLRLRIDVFVVEQKCPYPEVDGRDIESGTRHVWSADAVGPTAYLRILDEGETRRIGRVCTRPDARGAGLAARLMQVALESTAGWSVVLDAQSQLTTWYERFGFHVEGPEFVEDGIPHRPMRRD
jgi:ElaA protein